MTEIIEAAIGAIAINPYRRLHAYPYIESKIAALMASIGDVGLWPSVIARPLEEGGLWKYEQAFGHHRIEAARRLGIKTIPLIVDDLSDAQMLQYMGRENLEDYNAVFLIQLESWEAAIKSGLFLTKNKSPQPIGVASLLGWTRRSSQGNNNPIVNNTAAACNAAYNLIDGGYMSRDDFRDLSVEAARHIAERALSRIEQIEKAAKGSARSRRDVSDAKGYVARGAAETSRQFRQGGLGTRDLRSRVDFNAGITAARAEKPSPLFAVFANAVADNLRRTLNNDADAEKLDQIEKVLSQIGMMEDWEALRRLDVELVNLGERTGHWRKRLTPSREKIVQFTALEGGRNGQ